MASRTKKNEMDMLRQRNNRKRERAELLALLGGKCVRCGFSDPRALQVDHIHGGGLREIRALGRQKLYARMREHPTDYQILCANCNWIKRAENNEVKGGYQCLTP